MENDEKCELKKKNFKFALHAIIGKNLKILYKEIENFKTKNHSKPKSAVLLLKILVLI